MMDAFSGVLDLGEIFRTCGENIRPFVCGPEVDKYGIVAIGHTARTQNNLKVFALVMQCSHTNEVPHEVDIEVRLSKNPKNRIIKTKCSCLAGQGCCKHIISTSMRLFKMNIDDLEPISCTDLKQKWGKSSMSRRSKGIFRADELRKMCHFKPKTFKDPPIPDTFGQFVRDAFKTGNPTCELSLSMGKKRCTIFKPKKMSTMHKSVVRAIRTLTKSPSCKIIVQNGKANIPRKQASTQQQPSPILNPQPGSAGKPLEKVTLKSLVSIKGIVLGKKSENLPLIPPTPERFTVRKTYASRVTTHCKHQGKDGIRSDIVQVRPDQQALKANLHKHRLINRSPLYVSSQSYHESNHLFSTADY